MCSYNSQEDVDTETKVVLMTTQPRVLCRQKVILREVLVLTHNERYLNNDG